MRGEPKKVKQMTPIVLQNRTAPRRAERRRGGGVGGTPPTWAWVSDPPPTTEFAKAFFLSKSVQNGLIWNGKATGRHDLELSQGGIHGPSS